MKKLLALSILVSILVIASIAATCDSSCPNGMTFIGGKVYEEATGDKIKKADVTIICHGKNGDVSKTTKTGLLGMYSVLFSQDKCDYGDSVTVTAQKDGLTGTADGTVDKQLGKGCLEIDVGIIDVPLIPEFGLFVGSLTIVGAVGVFFFVRRK